MAPKGLILVPIFWYLFGVAHAQSLPAQVIVVVVPNAPSSLTATANSPTQASLSWTNNATQADGVSVERKTGSSGTYGQIATVPSSIATYTDNSLSASTLYYYRVRAFLGGVYSPYSNEASTTTLSAGGGGGGNNGGGGGGGGGGGYFPPPPTFQTAAIFRGIAYPGSMVTILENGQVEAVTQAGPDAKFEIDESDIAAGTYNFGIWASDPQGNRSVIQTFQVSVTTGATTIVSGIFFPPTITADKMEVQRGHLLTLLGYTAPQAAITIVVHSDRTLVRSATSTDTGFWTYKIPTDALAYGSHNATVHAVADGDVTEDSTLIAFLVGARDIAAPAEGGIGGRCKKADLNQDGSVNLVDFSIMAYWYGRQSPPAYVDLNGDGKVDLADFSILAYCWTG